MLLYAIDKKVNTRGGTNFNPGLAQSLSGIIPVPESGPGVKWLLSLSIRRFWGKGERWKRKKERASPPPPSPISNLLSPSPLGRPGTQANDLFDFKGKCSRFRTWRAYLIFLFSFFKRVGQYSTLWNIPPELCIFCLHFALSIGGIMACCKIWCELPGCLIFPQPGKYEECSHSCLICFCNI